MGGLFLQLSSTLREPVTLIHSWWEGAWPRLSEGEVDNLATCVKSLGNVHAFDYEMYLQHYSMLSPTICV